MTSDTLVVYFSRKGYVRALALEKAEKLNADVLALETSEPTKGIGGFLWCGRFGMHRWPMPLKPYAARVETYTRVVVCTPIWVFTACAPVHAFLSQNKGKFQNLEYTFVHFSFPMCYDHTVRAMDALSGRAASRYESVCMVLGKRVRTRTFALPRI